MAYTEVGRIRPKITGGSKHSIAQPYEVLDIVCDEKQTTAYMAIKNVPSGIELTNTDYWRLLVLVL